MLLDLGYALARPLLFRQDAETAHERVLGGVSRWPGLASGLAGGYAPPPGIGVGLAGLQLPSPVGLAAGLDKEARALWLWEKLGFGWVEIGTITPEPQPGNPRPRIHRLVEERAIINRMGFPSEGAAVVRARLDAHADAGRWPTVPVGINLGVNKGTPDDAAPAAYAGLVDTFRERADYFTVNVSSPNTPGLRNLQAADKLAGILQAARDQAGETPVFVKLAPDLEDGPLAEAVEVAVEAGCAGIIATNTTISRPGETGRTDRPGGLSGRPLYPIARGRLQVVCEAAAGRLPVVGVGGVRSAEQVRELLAMGCAAVQLYTGLIFEGPALARRINQDLAVGQRQLG